MEPRYESTFERLPEGSFGPTRGGLRSYPSVVRRFAAEGWRLVQVRAPGTAATGAASQYIELIFEPPHAG